MEIGCMLDTDQLKSFVAIVDTGSFTRAADRVNKTQSAVSMQIRRLEEQLGRPLFSKQGRGVRLTENGEKLIDYARQILQVEAAAFAAVSTKALAGKIRLGIPDDYAECLLPEIVTRFARRHPLVELTVVCDSSSCLSDRIGNGELDVAVVSDSVSQAEVLREEQLRWVVGANSCAHRTRPLQMALSSPTCNWRRAATTALDEAGVPWRQLLSSANLAALAPVVQAGLAVTVLPASAMRAGFRILDEAEEGLPVLPLDRIGLLEAKGSRTPEAKALAEEIRATLADQARFPVLDRPQEIDQRSGEAVLRNRARSAAEAAA
jgi:DNA-binding transcriptional LysR family regulator